jgi:cytoskeletal protein CcmA (bactofilin family)
MALFGKDDRMQRPEDSRPFVVGGPTHSSEAPAGDPTAQAHLGKGSRIEGKLTFEGSVQIDGQVEGDIEAQDSIVVGESAVVNAQISAGTIVLKGKVTGDLIARKRVELRAPAKLSGNITTPSLVIHEGVVFEGHCSMGGGAEAKAEKTDKKVALFPKEERISNALRLPSEAVNK